MQVLAGRLGGKADGNPAPEDPAAQNPDSALMAALLAAFLGCGPSGLFPENPSAPGAFEPDGEPVPIPTPAPPVPAPFIPGVLAEEAGNPQVPAENPATLPFPVPPSSDLLSRGEEQGGQPGGVDPAQIFTPSGKSPGNKENVPPDRGPGKISPDSFSIPGLPEKPQIESGLNQEKIEAFNPAAWKKNDPRSPETQDPANGKEVPGEQAFIPEPLAGAKSQGREEARVMHPLSKDPTYSRLAKEVPTGPREEKEGLPFPGTRQGQVFPSGKESQTLMGLYGTSAQSPSGPLEGAEKMAGGREVPAPMRSESQGISQQVGGRVLWLVRNQEERIKISLDPPELGHLFLEIHRTKENIQTTLYTDNPVTKVTLESNQREIQRIIESEGFKMERFDVLVQQDLSRFQERRNSPFHSDSGSSLVSGNREAPVFSTLESPSPVPLRMHGGSQYLDLFV